MSAPLLADVPGFLDRLEAAERERDLLRDNWIAADEENVRLRAQVEAVTRDHSWREIDTRSEYCYQEGVLGYRSCNGEGDPACSEECFETIRICNSCGTRDSCKVRAALSSVGPQPTEPKRVEGNN